jgi:hypothetical protein
MRSHAEASLGILAKSRRPRAGKEHWRGEKGSCDIGLASTLLCADSVAQPRILCLRKGVDVSHEGRGAQGGCSKAGYVFA